MKKHLFLTGERQIGKSTAINRFLEEVTSAEIRIGGFRSLKKEAEDGTGKVYIVSASDPVFSDDHVFMELGAWHADPQSADGETPRKPEPFRPKIRLDVFNREGVRLLRSSDDCQLILMDEIGFAESNAQQFREEVLRVLEGEIPVLGVLRKDETEFLRQLREHPEICTVTVTEENRDWIPELLAFSLKLRG